MDAWQTILNWLTRTDVVSIATVVGTIVAILGLVWTIYTYYQRPSSEPTENPGTLRARYLKLMAEEWRKLRLAMLDPTDASPQSRRPMTLEQVYVSLDTTTPRPERLRQRQEEQEAEPPLSVLEALWLAPEGHMVLLGQPGSGKSTFARHLLFQMVHAYLQRDDDLEKRLPGWKGQALLPVFVSLGRLAASTLTVENFIRDEIERRVKGYGKNLLEELDEAGGMVVFDGLDEVPGQQRLQIKEAVQRFAALHPRCRVLVTCRTHSYRQDEGWHLDWPTVHELAPFSDKKIEAFIDGWYQALSASDSAAAGEYQRKAAKLKIALAPDDRRKLRELARTPLLLTVMAIVHTHKTELPDSRVEVYRECVDILLLRWHLARTPDSPARSLKEELRDLGISDSKLHSGLLEMAYEAHKSDERRQLGGEGRALVSERVIRAVLHDYLGEQGLQRFLAYCQHANGLLLAEGKVQLPDAPQGRPVYAFPHLSFEEYLAALYLRQLEVSFAAELAGDPAWREVVRFLGESWCFGREVNIGMAQALLDALCPEQLPVNDADWRRNWLAGELLPAVCHEAAEKQRRPSLERRIRERLAQLLETPQALATAPQDRAAAGRALAVLSDPRPGVGVTADGLPELLWVSIPGTDNLRLGDGLKPDPEFQEEDEAWPADAPPLQLKPFFLAAYPVTVDQFRPFVESGAYQEDRYWTQAGIKDHGGQNALPYWNDPRWHLDNHPVIGVLWYEAVAYCRWLTERLRAVGRLPADYEIRLPTEAEWEWAARGPQGRRWPWGDSWQAGYCNSEESGINRTSAVGGFPTGVGGGWWDQFDRLPMLEPRGEVLHDLAGNVWEWCSTRWQNRYPLPVLATEWEMDYLEGEAWRVLRGGSFYNKQDSCRGASRGGDHPAYWHGYRGFRCCASTSSL